MIPLQIATLPAARPWRSRRPRPATRSGPARTATPRHALADSLQDVLVQTCRTYRVRHAALVTNDRTIEVTSTPPLEFDVLREHSGATVAAISAHGMDARVVLIGAHGIVASLAVERIERGFAGLLAQA